MEKWKLYALASAFFAGLTAVVAKVGLKDLSADLGLAVRTTFVLVLVVANLLAWPGAALVPALKAASARSYLLLGLSALTTTLSWICYYRAMKDGSVSVVALVDKGSILVTLLCAVLWLGEPFTWRLLLGGSLVLAGLLVLVPRR